MADLGKVFEGPWLFDDVPAPEEQLRKEMVKRGIDPPPVLLLDGNIHRFSTNPGDPKDDAGWYIVYPDNIPAGSFGDWRDNHLKTYNFSSKINRELSPAEQIEMQGRINKAKEEREKEKKRKHEQAAETVEKIWSSAKPAEELHPYLQTKHITPNIARMTGDGRLMLPMFNNEGKLSSIQYIAGDGEKRFHPGGETGGCYSVIGDILRNEIIYIVEGFATGATAHEATGLPVVIAYSAHNLTAVSKSIRGKNPSSKIVIIADNDKSGVGLREAERAAAAAQCTIIIPPEMGDINDYMINGGDVKLLLSEIKPMLDYYFADNLPEDYESPKKIVQGLIAEDSVSVLYGDSNAGKTFFALAMSGAIAEGVEFLNKKTKKGVVVFLATEAPLSIKQRTQAMQRYYGMKFENLCIVKTPVNFYESMEDANKVISIIKDIQKTKGPVHLIVADTLSRIAAGANENSGEDMGPVMKRFDMLKDQTGVSVLIIHHSGKDQARGARGWSGIRAHIDTEIEVTQSGSIHTAKVTKQRALSSKGDELHYKLHIMEMGIDEFGDPDTTCVAIHTDETPEDDSVKKDNKAMKKNVALFIDAWMYSGCDIVNDSEPYISESALKRYLIEHGKTKSTADQLVKISSGRMMAKMVEAGKVEVRNNGFVVSCYDMATTMLLRKQIKEKKD